MTDLMTDDDWVDTKISQWGHVPDREIEYTTEYNRHNASEKYQELYDMLKKLIKLHNPNFKYTSIQINKSVETDWHFDKGNVGLSYCLALGNFTGGGVVVRINPQKEKHYDNKRKWLYYDGHYLKHKSAPSKGTRYAIIFYTLATK